jgi:predicted kinase
MSSGPVHLTSAIYLVRGLPGAGKSTTATAMARGVEYALVYSADDFFCMNESGEYRFDRFRLPQAHAWCQARTRDALADGRPVFVANTFTERWEMEPYIQIAKEWNIQLIVIDIYDGGMNDRELSINNVHGVPQETITAMRNRWQHDWRSGDPRAPWERG